MIASSLVTSLGHAGRTLDASYRDGTRVVELLVRLCHGDGPCSGDGTRSTAGAWAVGRGGGGGG